MRHWLGVGGCSLLGYTGVNMGVMQAKCLLVLLLWFVQGHATGNEDSEQIPKLWAEMNEAVKNDGRRQPLYFRGRSAPTGPSSYMLPDYVVVSHQEVQKELFKPENVTKPLPAEVRKKLLAAAAALQLPPKPAPLGKSEVLCHFDRMFVRVSRRLFRQNVIDKLKLGSCNVSVANAQNYYFLYSHLDCGIHKEFNVDKIIYRNYLVYEPTGLIIRDRPYMEILECHFHRFFHSFKVGFYPLLVGQTYHKDLRVNAVFKLIPQDELGIEQSSYTLGQLMQFQASRQDLSDPGSQRLYINKCFMTATQDPSSKPSYTIIDNYGCMTDSKEWPESKFLKNESQTVQKFALTAFLFRTDSTTADKQKLYMHCLLTMGERSPSSVAKACTYDHEANQWKELYGSDDLCICCDAQCGNELTSIEVISSPELNIK